MFLPRNGTFTVRLGPVSARLRGGALCSAASSLCRPPHPDPAAAAGLLRAGPPPVSSKSGKRSSAQSRLSAFGRAGLLSIQFSIALGSPLCVFPRSAPFALRPSLSCPSSCFPVATGFVRGIRDGPSGRPLPKARQSQPRGVDTLSVSASCSNGESALSALRSAAPCLSIAGHPVSSRECVPSPLCVRCVRRRPLRSLLWR